MLRLPSVDQEPTRTGIEVGSKIQLETSNAFPKENVSQVSRRQGLLDPVLGRTEESRCCPKVKGSR